MVAKAGDRAWETGTSSIRWVMGRCGFRKATRLPEWAPFSSAPIRWTRRERSQRVAPTYSMSVEKSCSQKIAIPPRCASSRFSTLNTPASTAAGMTLSPKLRFQTAALSPISWFQPLVGVDLAVRCLAFNQQQAFA